MKRLELYGEPENLDVAEYIFHAILNQMEYLYEDFKKDHQKRLKEDPEYKASQKGYDYYGWEKTKKISKDSFIRGVLDAYSERLEKEHEKVETKIEEESNTLVSIYDKKLLKEMYGKAYPNVRNASYSVGEGSGYNSGRNAGKNLRISKGVSRSGNSGRLLN
jgi:hypothetical protein